jgi:cytochrome b
VKRQIGGTAQGLNFVETARIAHHRLLGLQQMRWSACCKVNSTSLKLAPALRNTLRACLAWLLHRRVRIPKTKRGRELQDAATRGRPADRQRLSMSTDITVGAAAGAVSHGGAGSAAVAAATHSATRILVWDWPIRVFHWALVLAVAAAIVTAEVGGGWMRWHGIAGLTILGLVVFRILWGFVGSTHARFSDFVPTPASVVAYLKGRWQGVGHNPLGALSVLALLGVLTLQFGTGLFTNDDIDFTGPLYPLVTDALAGKLTSWHKRTAYVLFALLAVHVAAIVFHAWIRTENLVKPMVDGHKQVEHGRPARQTGWLTLIVAVLVALAAVLLASGAAMGSGAV